MISIDFRDRQRFFGGTGQPALIAPVKKPRRSGVWVQCFLVAVAPISLSV